jgi:hypothetical protein
MLTNFLLLQPLSWGLAIFAFATNFSAPKDKREADRQAIRAHSEASRQLPQPLTPSQRQQLLADREKVWRAYFTNDQKHLEAVIPKETIAINAGEEQWSDRAAVLAGAQQFAQSGVKLVRLEFPRTEIQVYGDVAILYTAYLFELEDQGQRQTYAGRGTEIFVRRGGTWVNSGWHLDSGN